MTRRSLQALLAVLLLGGGLLLSASMDKGTTGDRGAPPELASLDAPSFYVEIRPDRVTLRGTTVSAAHEAGLKQFAADQFAPRPVHTDFSPGVIIDASWASASESLLYALAATESARATLRQHAVEIRGATLDRGSFTARLRFLRDQLPPDTELITGVVTINAPASHEALCRQAFATLHIEPIAFEQSSARIRTSSHGTLDRIVDFANDCRELQIAVTGHSDASGNEAWNQRLSLQRAQAVVDYLVSAGIDAGRLRARGLGSAEPVADNASAAGRSLNRRIEFTLL